MNRISSQFQTSLTLLVFLLVAMPLLHGDDTGSLSRDKVIALALGNNRELKIAALEINRATSRVQWSGRLENPELELSARDDGVGLDEGEGNYEIAFSQRFPLTAKLKKETGLRKYQVILAEAETAERRRQIAGEVDRALVELLSTREKIRLGREGAALNKEIVNFLEGKVKVGEISKLDLIQATLGGRTLDQEVKSLLTRERQQGLALNQLIGLEATTELRFDGSLALPGSRPPSEADLGTILARRPDHVLALAKTDEARAAILLEEAKRWEDIAVKVFVEGDKATDNPTGLEKNTFAGVGISIPIPFRQRNQDGIARAKIDEESATQGVEAARFTVRAECEEAYQARLDAWDLAREAGGELLTLAGENLAEFRKAYERGEATLTQVQKAQEQVLELRAAAAAFISDYHLAEARVRFVTGAYPGLNFSQADK
ncbi:MAG TPA: TolC family protein [Verrucomicrobiales bacterium]|nr:TolC family protein [Verrucomicrobiales bacterium]